MIVYHRTQQATAIMREGFRDAEDPFGTAEIFAGVWVSAEPLDENEGAAGNALIQLEIPEALFVRYEWVEEGKTYREALIPASDLNLHLATARLLSEDELDEAPRPRFDL
jgi:hypothetical protein